MLFIKDGKAFEEAKNGDYKVLVEVPSQVITTTPPIRYSGPKIPIAVWKQVLSFFQVVFQADKSECQVRLYRNKVTGEWKAWAFPQTKKGYMTTRELPHVDPELWAKSLNLFGQDWVHCGSVHHHCSTDAFQSTTDRNDEVNAAVVGIHLTVGHMDKPVYDLHSRAVVNVMGELNEDMSVKRPGATYTGDVNLSDWFDIGVDLTGIPIRFHADITKEILATPSNEAFPSEWLENLVQEFSRPNVTGFGGGGHVGSGSGTGFVNYDDFEWQRRQQEEAARRIAQLRLDSHTSIESVNGHQVAAGEDFGWDNYWKGGL